MAGRRTEVTEGEAPEVDATEAPAKTSASTLRSVVLRLRVPFLIVLPIAAFLLSLAMVVGGGALLFVRWHLNPLSFGEEEARAMGAETGKLRAIIIVACTLLTASAVSVAGIIGWVGLIIPHLARGLVGPDYGKLLPVSAVIGAVYLLLVDDLARLAGPLELPLGILTALIGAPFFILLMARTRRAWT